MQPFSGETSFLLFPKSFIRGTCMGFFFNFLYYGEKSLRHDDGVA